ncbi:MAG: protein-disulfide reductase DsbD domain-containing protein, partial [Alphaproteobacteria bacterium]
MQYYIRMLSTFFGFVCLIFMGTAAATSVHNSTFVTDQGRVTLIAGSSGSESRQKTFLGLHFEMKEGWKIYWRSPGDAGFPPQIRWDRSQNVKEFDMLWPLPKRFSVLGLATLGYEDEVVLPIAVRVLNKNRPVLIRANLSYLTCNKVCIPYDTELQLELKNQVGFISIDGQLIGRYLKRVPVLG